MNTFKRFKALIMEHKPYKQPQFLKIDGSMLEGGGQVTLRHIIIIVIQNDTGPILPLASTHNN